MSFIKEQMANVSKYLGVSEHPMDQRVPMRIEFVESVDFILLNDDYGMWALDRDIYKKIKSLKGKRLKVTIEEILE